MIEVITLAGVIVLAWIAIVLTFAADYMNELVTRIHGIEVEEKTNKSKYKKGLLKKKEASTTSRVVSPRNRDVEIAED